VVVSVLGRARSVLTGELSGSRLRLVLVANLVGQMGIVLTGGIVRLTGSGLGCPTFPECVPGSYVPVLRQPQGFHKFIEFGNRMLTFVLTVLVVATLIAVIRFVRSHRELDHSRRLLVLGTVPIVGVFAQALVGGISVLTDLNPGVVASHFLLSMALIAESAVLLLVAARAQQPLPPVSAPAPVRALSVAVAVMAAVVLSLGTLVTGSGPHSGDAHDTHRFSFDIPSVAHLHSGAVWVFVVLLVALIVTFRRQEAPAWIQRRALILFAVTMAQGVIGYVQYALGVPGVLVAFHMLGATLITAATTFLTFGVLTGRRAESTDPLVLAAVR
jgi:cytochrome c oxidase assembly protein subunit 15